MNTDFKVGGQELRFATSAENVKYGSGTVKEFLDDIKNFDTSGMSEFGKKLYAADEKEFKRLLEISSEGIWDAGQTRRQGNAIVTDDTAEKSWLWRRSFYDKIFSEKRQSADKYDVQCFRCVYGIC